MTTRTLLACSCALSASLAAAAELSREDALRRAVDRAKRIDDRFVRTWARYAIAEEWAHTDPARAAELADTLESWTAKRDLLSVVMFAWGQRDPKAAGQWGIAFKNRTKGTLAVRNTALHYAVVGMAATDPKRADELIWTHLQEDGWGGHPRHAPMDAARQLATADPAAALAMALKIQHEGCRVDALRTVLREWAKRDPKAAAAALSGRREKRFQDAYPRDLAEGWAHKNPREAAAYAKTIPQRRTRVLALAGVARQVAAADPAAAAELCSILAPLNVGKWHEQMPRGGMIVREVAEAYARGARQAAVRWAASLPDKYGGCRREAFDGVAAGWAATDPKAALAFYTSQEEGKRPSPNRGTGAAYPSLARQLAKTDVGAALQVARKTKRLVLKSHIIHDVAVVLAERDPRAAARLVGNWEAITDYYTYRPAAAAVAARAWARQSPKAAAAWAATLKPTRDRQAALRAVAAAWARRSRSDACAWAEALKNPQDAVHALLGLAEALRKP